MSTPAIKSDKRPGGIRSGGSFAIAIGVHLLALLMVPEFRATLRELAPTSGDFIEVEPDPPPPPPPEVEPPPAPPTQDRAAPTVTETVAQNAAPPPEDTAVEALPELIETDLVLSNNTFSVPTTSGTPSGPIQSGRVTGSNAQGLPGGTPDGEPGGTGIARTADLSVRPSPPGELDTILQRNYPPLARQQAIEADAYVNVEILPDGSVGRVRRGSESIAGYGFAQACIATVREGGAWQPGRDQAGAAVASQRRFRCQFVIRR